MTKNRASLELVFAGVLWGFGFVAAVWALRAFTPIETLVYRFLIASFFGELFVLLYQGPKFSDIKTDLLRAFPAGLLLGGMLLLQTIGLQFTSATKSGFLTSLYVIFVPLLNTLFFKTTSRWRNYFLVAVALLGTFILMGAHIDNVNVGDLWTIACSILAALHIMYIGRISHRVQNAFRFNNFQSFWCLLILAPLLLTQEKVQWTAATWEPWLGVVSLGLASSIIAFYLQIRTQKVLSDATASMLFLLESPFAALFGFLILQERLTVFQMSGAGLILVASILQIIWDPSSKTIETKP